jgi:hypothetical protein
MKIIRQREQHTETTHEHISGFVNLGPVPITRQWTDPAIGICDWCGRRVELASSYLNTCYVCGADYDGNGERLALREQWGEETGEHPADVSRIG